MVTPIVETKVMCRADTSTPFYQMTAEAAAYIYSGPLLDDGSYSETRVLSEDGLTYTITYTYNNLTTYSMVGSLQADYRIKFIQYYTDTNFAGHVPPEQFGHRRRTQTGLAVPFTVVTTYNFAGATELVAAAISELSARKCISQLSCALSIHATSNSIVTIQQYNNSDHFTEFAHQHATGYIATHESVRSVFVNRSIQYALV